MNEGHAAFAALEAARAAGADGTPFAEALEDVRRRTVFTTHTPVPAGNDTYPAERVDATLRRLAEGAGTDIGHVLRLGRTHPDDEHEPFGVTQFALRASRAANGVSRRHGGVSRGMWQGLWPDRGADDVPIGHVTNGVHVPSWVGGPMRRLLDRHLGEGWARRTLEPEAFAAIDDIPDEELWQVRCEQRGLLVDYVGDRSQLDRIARGEPREYVEAAAKALDPGVLTVGFARRLATYKRLNLLLHDPQRSLNLVRSRPADPAAHRRQGAPARTTTASASCSRCSARAGRRASPGGSSSSRTTTSASPRGSCAAATCGSTSRGRRSRRAGRAA